MCSAGRTMEGFPDPFSFPSAEALAAIDAAQIQAAAAIQAARIGAEAASSAAWIQGGATFAAGVLALVAAGVAAVTAYRGAVRQVRLEEQRHVARVMAYRSRLLDLAECVTIAARQAHQFAVFV